MNLQLIGVTSYNKLKVRSCIKMIYGVTFELVKTNHDRKEIQLSVKGHKYMSRRAL